MNQDEAGTAFREFVQVIKALRTPVTGCPWDLQQDHQTLRRYLIEECHEVVDAIEQGNDQDLCEELGDLLLQVVLHAQVAADRQAFTIVDVVRSITAKMIRRHPHVFGTTQVSSADEVTRNWEQIKQAEKQARGESTANPNPLASIPASLPALLRAQRVAEKAEQIQQGTTPPLDTVDTQGRTDRERALGDRLFELCQQARREGLNAEDCLRAATRRFIEGFARGD